MEYTRDVSVGPKVLAQTAESLRKLRNSARFLLGTVGEYPSIEVDRTTDMVEELKTHLENMDMVSLILFIDHF